MINRRHFVVTASAVGLSGASPRRARANDGTRAAVVIGVDKAGDLPRLRSAAKGATEVGGWLSTEGFHVELFTDASRPVKLEAVADAVQKFIAHPTLRQLVIYFSGHGFQQPGAEVWMLSGAPIKSSESVNVFQTAWNARYCGVPHISIISDSCRSIPTRLVEQQAVGTSIFPGGSGGNPGKVDTFFATQPASGAVELPVSKTSAEFHSLFTTGLLQAFKQPYQSMVLDLPDGRRVVPNRRLERYLVTEVQLMAERIPIQGRQIPEINVTSDEPAFIGRLQTPTIPPVADPPSPPVTVKDVARNAVWDVARLDLGRVVNLDTSVLDAAVGFSKAQGKIERSDSIADVEINTMATTERPGFVVHGATVTAVGLHPALQSTRPQIAPISDGSIVRIDVPPNRPATNVVLQFADGSGAILPLLPRYTGSITVDASGITNVSYLSGDATPNRSGKVEQLHGVAATATRFGVFRIEGNDRERQDKARQIGDQIRVLKRIDPTLGMYAAYAYADADLPEQVESVRNVMSDDIQAVLFDVALLAGRTGISAPARVLPICPLLTQGWQLARAKGIPLHRSVRDLGKEVKLSLWTTFRRPGVEELLLAIRAGSIPDDARMMF